MKLYIKKLNKIVTVDTIQCQPEYDFGASKFGTNKPTGRYKIVVNEDIIVKIYEDKETGEKLIEAIASEMKAYGI